MTAPVGVNDVAAAGSARVACGDDVRALLVGAHARQRAQRRIHPTEVARAPRQHLGATQLEAACELGDESFARGQQSDVADGQWSRQAAPRRLR